MLSEPYAKGIIAPSAEACTRHETFVWAMMAARLSAALRVISSATWLGAPVSTTHSVVGGVMGAGIAAAGFAAVNWPTMSKIAASWVISPVLGVRNGRCVVLVVYSSSQVV